jgi:hypothetical protein
VNQYDVAIEGAMKNDSAGEEGLHQPELHPHKHDRNHDTTDGGDEFHFFMSELQPWQADFLAH